MLKYREFVPLQTRKSPRWCLSATFARTLYPNYHHRAGSAVWAYRMLLRSNDTNPHIVDTTTITSINAVAKSINIVLFSFLSFVIPESVILIREITYRNIFSVS